MQDGEGRQKRVMRAVEVRVVPSFPCAQALRLRGRKRGLNRKCHRGIEVGRAGVSVVSCNDAECGCAGGGLG